MCSPGGECASQAQQVVVVIILSVLAVIALIYGWICGGRQ